MPTEELFGGFHVDDAWRPWTQEPIQPSDLQVEGAGEASSWQAGRASKYDGVDHFFQEGWERACMRTMHCV